MSDKNICNLRAIKQEIDAICKACDVNSNELELCVDVFSFQDREILLSLLKKKLQLQEMIYTQQGGSLENIEFLCSYQLRLSLP